MPRVFRVMKVDPDGLPRIGAASSCLGVRVPEDITPDAEALVRPCGEGMSVNRSLVELPFMYIPKKYRTLVEGAKASNSASVWETGRGGFFKGALTNEQFWNAWASPRVLSAQHRR